MSFLNEKDELIWVDPKEDEALVTKIIDEFNVHEITAKLLINRGLEKIDDINKYLYSKLPDLIDPSLFPTMDKAVERISKAIDEKEGILIYGDNDVDGMTGTALLCDFLKLTGARVLFFSPSRSRIRQSDILDALNYALDHKCSLLITVDCGIKTSKEIEKFIPSQVEVIITDHHEPGDTLPSCVANLNPKLPDTTYPNRELTGVGVAFKLAHGLTNYLIAQKKLDPKKVDLKNYLDLVALGTVADMGVLKGENRTLVQYGLKQLKDTERKGLKKLFEICEINPHEVSANLIGTKIAPRLNSLGRIADPLKGIYFLLADCEDQALKLAQELDLNNSERQRIEKLVAEEIDTYIISHPEILKDKAIVLSSSNWHPGIIPILAAKVAKQYNRPTLIISVNEEGIGKGSMRTIKEFPLVPFLKKQAPLMINFGGHDMASGLSIESKNIPLLKQKLIETANKHLKTQDVHSKLYLDAQANFKDLTFDLMDSFNLLEPYGNENPPPILHCHAKQAWPPKVINKQHLKLFLEQGEIFLEGIALGMASRRQELYKKGLFLHIAYTPQVNYYQNKASIQLVIRDFKIRS